MMLHETQKGLRFGYSFLQKRFIHLHMQILYACNFRCRICHFWKNSYRRMPRMKVSQAKIIADRLKQLGPLIVCLGGGEPLVHTELSDIVRLFSKHHYVSMISNGWFMTPEKARALFQAGMQQVCVSVDYADPKKHDELRGIEGAYDRAIRALKSLHENRVHPRQRVHMISVVMDDNLEEIEPLIHLSEKLGVTYLVNLYSACRGQKEGRVSKNISQHLSNLKQKYRNFVSLPGYLAKFSEAVRAENGVRPCYAGKSLLNIDSQGNVGFCIDRLEELVGNILTEDIAALQKKLFESYLQNECGDCWTSCRGSIEPLLYGDQRLQNLWQSYQIFKNVPLGKKPVEEQDIIVPEYQY